MAATAADRDREVVVVLGIIAVAACPANMLLPGGWMFADLFVAPSFAHAAPEILDGQSPAQLSAGFLAAWFADTSFILLGIASLRARVLPITSSIAGDPRRCPHRHSAAEFWDRRTRSASV